MQIVSQETICMKCQILFSGKNEKNIVSLSSVEFVLRVLEVNFQHTFNWSIKLQPNIASINPA